MAAVTYLRGNPPGIVGRDGARFARLRALARTWAFTAARSRSRRASCSASARSAWWIRRSPRWRLPAPAYGASLTGLRPVGEFQFMDFISSAHSQIVQILAKSNYRWGAPAPLVLRGPSGGGVSGGPFHSQNPEMFYVHTPGLKVICPATARDAKGLIKSAIRDNNPGPLLRA